MAQIKAVEQCLAQLNQIILGKEHEIKLALTCLLAKGHLLIEDLPGMGKTTLSHALSKTLGLSYQRVQFTNDMLPADLLGVNIFDKGTGKFSFHPGPIFANVVLADEINRASPKTQSALLEAMEEKQVTTEGETRPLPPTFFVIATQNPSDQAGTYPLPESQLDRFMMRISLGYPDAEAEKALLLGVNRRDMVDKIQASVSEDVLPKIQQLVVRVKASERLVDYLYKLVEYSRLHTETSHGLSPRAAMALLQASKAWALIDGRNHVTPDDVQAVFPSVAEHRISGGFNHPDNPNSIKILKAVDIF